MYLVADSSYTMEAKKTYCINILVKDKLEQFLLHFEKHSKDIIEYEKLRPKKDINALL